MRIVKDAAKRKDEILDAAGRLFQQKGFDATSTNDILECVGIARGTLYYHFRSKEEIMDALIERCNTHLLEAARTAAADRSIPVKERFMRTVTALNVTGGEGGEGGEMLRHLHRPQNALMHQKIQRAAIAGVPPILADLVREGIEQGIFHTLHPFESIEMIVVYATTIFDVDMAELTGEERGARIRALIHNMELLLGARPGSLSDMAPMFGAKGGS